MVQKTFWWRFIWAHGWRPFQVVAPSTTSTHTRVDVSRLRAHLPAQSFSKMLLLTTVRCMCVRNGTWVFRSGTEYQLPWECISHTYPHFLPRDSWRLSPLVRPFLPPGPHESYLPWISLALLFFPLFGPIRGCFTMLFHHSQLNFPSSFATQSMSPLPLYYFSRAS